MKSILHKAEERGGAEMGWLSTRYSFSFADYRNPERMGFGTLRVLNDDAIAGGGGFGRHGHRDMEIVTIMLEGALEHADSMGNKAVIRGGYTKENQDMGLTQMDAVRGGKGNERGDVQMYDDENIVLSNNEMRHMGKFHDVQVMSAGTGVFHSEINASKTEEVKLLQIWITPNTLGVAPRYGEVTLDPKDRHNKLQTIISPRQSSSNNNLGMWLYSNSWFHLGNFDKGKTFEYKLKSKENGLYVFVIEGSVEVGDQSLNTRDALGLWSFDTVTITATTKAEVLLMEVPMR